MSAVGDIGTLWGRIEAWPDALRAALVAEAETRARVDSLQRQLDHLREFGTGKSEDDDNEYDDGDGGEDLAWPPRAYIGMGMGRPPTREQLAAQRTLHGAARALESARSAALTRLVREYEGKNMRAPAQKSLAAMVDSDDDVKEKREALEQARAAYDELELEAREQANVVTTQPSSRRKDAPPELEQLVQALSQAETDATIARAEVRHQRAVGRSLALLVQLACAEHR